MRERERARERKRQEGASVSDRRQQPGAATELVDLWSVREVLRGAGALGSGCLTGCLAAGVTRLGVRMLSALALLLLLWVQTLLLGRPWAQVSPLTDHQPRLSAVAQRVP